LPCEANLHHPVAEYSHARVSAQRRGANPSTSSGHALGHPARKSPTQAKPAWAGHPSDPGCQAQRRRKGKDLGRGCHYTTGPLGITYARSPAKCVVIRHIGCRLIPIWDFASDKAPPCPAKCGGWPSLFDRFSPLGCPTLSPGFGEGLGESYSQHHTHSLPRSTPTLSLQRRERQGWGNPGFKSGEAGPAFGAAPVPL
jgi:hypothetical protein